MANENKRIYWWKCNHEFFNGTKLIRLRKTKGFNFDSLDECDKLLISRLAMECIYIKLLSESCTHGGTLLYDDGESYDDEGLSEILESPVDFWLATKERLTKLNLFSQDENGKITLPELPQYIQSEGKSAIRMRRLRVPGDDFIDTSVDSVDTLQTTNDTSVSTVSTNDCDSVNIDTKRHIVTPDRHFVTPERHIVTPDRHINAHCDAPLSQCSIDIRYKNIDNRNQNNNTISSECCSVNNISIPTPSITYSLDRLIAECKAITSIPAKHVEAFAKYVFANAICEKEGKKIYGLRVYLNTVYKAWASDHLYEPEMLIAVSIEEAKQAFVKMNEQRTVKATYDQFDSFWNWLIGEDFKKKNGELVTRYNVRKVMSNFLQTFSFKTGKHMSSSQNTSSTTTFVVSQELNNKLLTESYDD